MNYRLPKTESVASTLVELLCDRAIGRCAANGFTFFRGDDLEDQWLRYSELHQAAQRIAVGLSSLETAADDQPARAIILCPPGPSYLKALFGTFYSGMVAVTAYPPRARRRDERLDGVIADSQATIAIVDQTIANRRDQIIKSSPVMGQLQWLSVDEPTGSEAAPWVRPDIAPDATAVLQYTSGSTAEPKGVCLTHRNVLSNLRMIYESFEIAAYEDHWSVTWLPPYHDMGLIGGLLQVMFAGECTNVIPPASFVQKPIRWLRAIDRYRATVSGGPNFAYDACVDRITATERESLDLSSWSLAFTGAEPIRAKSLDRFAEAFAENGFDRRSFFPCYGLAEATLMVCGGPRRRDPVVSSSRDGAVTDATSARPGIVSCGTVRPGQEVRIVDPNSLSVVPAGAEGEVWVSGENVSPGYWRRPIENQEVFKNRLPGEELQFMRTGDLGYLDDGELYISGRLKELIIVRGRNLQPSDVEMVAAECHPMLVANASAAFEVETDAGPALAIVQEIDRGNDQDLGGIAEQIRVAVVEAFELEPGRIIFIPKRALPKTSSGKVKRLETKRLYQTGQLGELFAWRAADATRSGKETAAAGQSYDANTISQWLVRRLANQLQRDPREINVTRPFVQYGLDSVSAVQIASELESFIGREIPATLMYEAPTIEAVATRLGSNDQDDASAEQQESKAEQGRRTARSRTSDVAIVGVACRLPGSDNVDEFWRLLRTGQTAISEPPEGRESCISPSATTQRAGWVSRPDLFDAELFGISPREACCIDPQHRWVLEVAWRAVEDAGIDPRRLAGTRTGAFVGISNCDYERLILRQQTALSTYMMTGNASSMAANRLSYHFNLRGPSLAVDTACSSSLVAVHQAVRAIGAGDCDAALVAGVNLILSPEVSDTLSDAEMLSPQGRCKTFDAEANGYVRGEGCVALLLKPLDDAIASGDRIRAVIRGSAVNQDGLTNGITAPNGDSQSRLYRQALAEAGVRPVEVTLLEAHGTGTALGDPIEVSSLQEVYGSAADGDCHLGAVKANIGHLEAAAGLAGLLKVVLELQHRESAPQPNLNSISPHIDLSGSRFTIPTEQVSWQDEQPRIAAVSSFGFGGTNAHLILAEHVEQDANRTNERTPQETLCLVTLSAQNLEALRKSAAAHARLIDDCEDWHSVASETRRQKTSHRHRVAIVADSRDRLASLLRQFALGESSAAIHTGTVPADGSTNTGDRATVDDRIKVSKGESGSAVYQLAHPCRDQAEWRTVLDTFAELFVAGAIIDWDSVETRSAAGPRTVLPGHPFNRKSFWIEQPQAAKDENASAAEPLSTAAVIDRITHDRQSTTDDDSSSEEELVRYAAAVPHVDRLVVSAMQGALVELGIEIRPGDTIDPNSVVSAGIVTQEHEQLLRRICEILSQRGILSKQHGEDRWNVLQGVSDEADWAAELVTAQREWPIVECELQLVSRCGSALSAVLHGDVDPLSVLFPDGDASDLLQLYRSSPLARISNRLVAEAAQAVADLKAAGTANKRAGLRVLEVGAGTGGTTSAVLPAIAEHLESYWFTDASPLLVASSSGQFGTDHGIEYHKLDIELPPNQQGVPEGTFDLVIAANVLHATADLRTSLTHVRRLLREDGFMVALEGVRPEYFLDLVFGMTKGWWRFRDADLRPDYPLISERQWVSLLSECEFDGAVGLPYPVADDLVRECQSVLIARGGVAASPNPASDRTAATFEPHTPANLPQAPTANTARWIEAFHAGQGQTQAGALEGYLREAVAAVLGHLPGELDLDQPVSNLGIDSLMAIQLKNRLEADLGLSVPMIAFLEGKSVRQLIDLALESRDRASTTVGSATAETVSTSLGDDKISDRSAALSLESDEEHVLGPMSEGQLALWMIHQRAPTGPAYNFAFAARTSGKIDHGAMTKACRSLVKRHPDLRTYYRLEGDQPVRVLSGSIDVVIGEQDCHDWSESRILEWIREEADRPFDLEQGPIIRFSLLRCKSGDVLSIAMHHIAADLWSMDVLIQELIDLYAMIIGGGEIELGPLPTTYDAYVQWERELDGSDEGERLWEFWRDKLQGAPHTLNLPTTYSRPSEQTFHGSSHQWDVPAEIVDGLRQVAQDERTTMFTILLSAYQAFLSRVCSQDDLLVGTVSASRGRAEWEGIVGYFLNHLVLRSRITGSPTFRELLRGSQREVLDALEHQAFPFAKLVEKIGPRRDPSRSPIVQTMFIWDKPRNLTESHFAPGKSSDRMRLKPLLMEQRGAPFDLTLIVFELEDQLKLTFRYNTDLFSAEAIESLAESFDQLVGSIANDPDTLIQTVPIVPPAQERTIAEWNATDAALDESVSPYGLFQRFARQTPDAVAIESDEEQLTYAEADAQATRIADRLGELEAGPGDIVAVLAPRSVHAIVAILGVWKSGAAYLPLDPNHPDARLQAICDDACPIALLTSQDTAEPPRLSLSCPTLSLSEVAGSQTRAAGDRDGSDTQAEPDSPAYVIYTSGSTGRPKGVVVPNRGVANLALAQQRMFGVVPNDRCLQFASLGFDASVFEIVMAFHAGATLFVLDADVTRTTTTETAAAIRRARINNATLPPSLLATIPADDLPELHTLVSAGEACSAALVDKWGKNRRIFNAYGPTEATVWASTQLCEVGGGDPSIGTPITNVRAYVVDENLQTMPLGVPGELCLSSPGLASEYRNLPAATAEAFVPNPFDQRYDVTLYRTGDRARWTHAGTLEFLGRIDDQVKIDGHRIEPGEIAAVIQQRIDVASALVTTMPSGVGEQLIAYVVLRSDLAKDVESQLKEIRQQLSAQLPCYMVPKRFIPLDRFPLNASGKVDVAKLPRPTDLERRADVPIAPRTPTEEKLAEIWREVLRTDQIGVQDNFFDLGGASLQALQAADRAAQLGFDVSAERMFQFQTIEELAREIDASGTQPDQSAARPAVPEITTRQPSISATNNNGRHVASSVNRMVIESIGTYLPPDTLSTGEVVEGCRKPLDFPLQKMTGIVSRHVAGREEFSIDLARRAAIACLEQSRFRAEELDLLIACNISRYDAPDGEFSFEPSTASRLKQQIGARSAVAFDVCNACAGFFTALAVAEARLLSGESKRAMIVSGEYITHLTKTAQLEIDGFLDPRLACLTLGDAGAAVIVELKDDGTGFEALDLYTAGSHHELCVARATDQPHGGAIMLTDAIKASAVALDHSVGHAHRVVDAHRWGADEVSHVIMHQTSTTTLDGAIEELNRHFGQPICNHDNTVNNLAQRGNTASTTHWVAVMDLIRQRRINPGDKAVFAISGSGQTIGTALYQFDDLPKRIGASTRSTPLPAEPTKPRRYGVQVVAATVDATKHSVNSYDPRYSGHFVVESAACAADSCLRSAAWDADDVDLIIHSGVYRDDFLSEPAIAAIIAGELKMNSDRPHQGERQTLALDLLDSGRGVLTACSVVASMIGGGKISRGLVTASEVENNPLEEDQRGIAELGSALALQRTDDPQVGFGEFQFSSYPEYASKLTASTRLRAGGLSLVIERADDLDQILVHCVADAVARFCKSSNREVASYQRILLSLSSTIDRSRLASTLGVATDQVYLPDDSAALGKDMFTSGIAALWNELAHGAESGERWLLVSAGAGIEVACVDYQHGES